VKLSVSLPEDDVARLDEYMRTSGAASRSAAIQQAIRLLAQARLEDEYSAAWEEWENSPDATAWQTTIADGLGQNAEHAAR
jgi:Arc/MetJ-type ribon-helix-helix transcriptional regulator